MERFDLELAMRLWRAHRSLRRHEMWSPERLSSFQAAALGKLRAHAYANSAFYRRWHAGRFDRPLAELPILTKEHLLEVFDEAVTDPGLRRDDLDATVERDGTALLHDRYVVVSTSGSTGRPGRLAYDVREWAWFLASLGRVTTWAGLDPGGLRRRRIATVGTLSPWHVTARAAMTLPSWWLPSLRLDATTPIDEMASQLTRWQPDLLVTYGSLLAGLAGAQLEGRLDITPRAVVTGADALPAGARDLARRAWSTPVFDEYAATEAAGIAAECEAHEGLHLYEDLLVAEPVDDDGRIVPPGAPASRVLVTVLFGRTLPLIRYEIRDGVRLLPGPCPCGRPFRRIAKVDGRSSEALELRDGRGKPVLIHPVVVHEVMDDARVAAWQLVEEVDRLRLLVVASPDGGAVDAAVVATLTETLGRHGVVVPPISLEVVDGIDREPSGKIMTVKPRRRAVAEVPTPEVQA
jgi:phenylacetate-CoA ligase